MFWLVEYIERETKCSSITYLNFIEFLVCIYKPIVGEKKLETVSYYVMLYIYLCLKASPPFEENE